MQRALSVFILIVLFAQSFAQAQPVGQLVTNEEKVRQQMITLSRELGVTCTQCHNISNFKEDSKKSFKISLDHMKLTQMLKEKGFDGKKGPEATCYMCHRGKLLPDYKEPANAKAL